MTRRPSNFGEYVGLSGYDVVGDRVVVKLPLEDKHLNQLGLAHGGAIATLVDNSMGLACLSAFKKPLVTVEFSVNFVRPAHAGTLTATSHVYRKGDHLAFAECDVTDGSGLLVAKAFGTYMAVERAP
ncbi:MAG TPA: PaaI family thioesterase [Conexivisphaerales archaeon]|nr:PaaI family thioesterase [Conexivisphaerales archaeon]